MRVRHNRRGVTLVEVLTVLTALGVMMFVIHTVFISNWFAYEERITRSGLWQEAGEIFEAVSRDGRSARQIDVAEDVQVKTATFIDREGDVIAIYSITDDGLMHLSRPGDDLPLADRILSARMDFDNSSFLKEGRALNVTLAMHEGSFLRDIAIRTSTEVYPRN